MPVGTIKRFISGAGNASKDAVIAAVKARGYAPADDNEADAIAILLFFGGLLMSAIMFMIGRTEYLKYGLVGAGLGGLAWVIVTTFFTAGNGVDPGIQLQNF